MALTLVLGGIRSGKSAFALRLAGGLGGRVAVVATALPSDQEMSARIEAHRRSRPADWKLVEEPVEIGTALAPGSADVVLLESVDAWLANRTEPEECLRQVRALCRSVPQVVAVSSEAGLSPVPLTPAGRSFVDALGTVNQALAAQATRVYLVVAGLPITLKEVST